jgi:DNA replication protein DnaC
MLAMLALREAINLRWKPGHDGDSYCYVKYSDLIHHLLAQANDDKSFDQRINLYKDCDWLVVDEIGRGSSTRESEAAKRFKANVLNSLFGERLAAGLPNILVFQEDLSKMVNDLDQEYGSSLTDIVRNKKTHKIALIEDGK